MAQPPPPEFHRQLRSLFAILRTLVRRSASHHASVEDFSAHLEGRIGCLARSHDMLMRAPPEGVDLVEILYAELLAQTVPDDHFNLHGPDIRIDGESAVSLALAFHELTMNAITHGRLAHHRGAVEVRWQPVTYEQATWLQVVWSERSLSIETPDSLPKGFGAELIERMLPYELGAHTSRQHTHDSLRVELLIPQTPQMPNWRLCALSPMAGDAS